MSLINEKAFETNCEDLLIQQGYHTGNPAGYDRERAYFPAELVAFIQATQPKQWQKWSSAFGAKAEPRLFSRICDELASRGMLDVLRGGITDFALGGERIRLCFFRPASGLNPDAAAAYAQNKLTVTRQVHYSLHNENSLDMLLSLNGLPIVTVELKNHMTGQTVTNAIAQYKNDRSPKELLFQFKKRTLVHFAVDPDLVYMATKLDGTGTYFLPFNKGLKGGAGNPIVVGKHRTDYLWEEVLAPDSMMDILEKFLHLQAEDRKDKTTGDIVKKETMIFPRYHQLDVVRKLEADVKANGAGDSYLIQHSAGSGKSNSIAWMAHRLAGLHDAANQAIYSSVVVVTDRKVLDKQLQDTIFQFEHKAGVVAKIDENSTQLAEALSTGTRIIITTLQKFPFILEKVGDLKGKNFAVIVDEAHSSQSGEASRKLRAVLADVSLDEAARQEEQQEAAEEDYEDVIQHQMAATGKHKNLSFFAFTATPKSKTLEVFGRIGADGKPCPYHLYSMRQAIEEGFILDVLKNYTTYATYYKITKAVEDDPQFDKSRANRAIGRYLSLHPFNIAQKTQVMVEHFRSSTQKKIGGKGKAMVVTGSRLHAVRYYREFKRYIQEKGYTDMDVLVAFSGTVIDDGEEFTETGMNKIGEKELPEKFDSDDYQVLIVAEKYQTGFDQPLLHTMFVDKKLTGVKAVQTLSRLNRINPGKDDTFILDFVNELDTIRKAFQPYYEQTGLEETTDPNVLYDIKHKLDALQVYTDSEVETFAKAFFSVDTSKQAHSKIDSSLNPAVDRFNALEPDVQEDFRVKLKSFDHIYSFITQIVRNQDAGLHKFAAYARLLQRKLPDPKRPTTPNLDNDVALEYYRLEKIAESAIDLKPGEGGNLPPSYIDGRAKKSEEQKEPLSVIVDNLNTKFGTSFTEMDKVLSQMVMDFEASEDMIKKAEANPIENFRFPFTEAFDNIAVTRMMQNDDFFRSVLGNAAMKTALIEQMLPVVYDRLKGIAKQNASRNV